MLGGPAANYRALFFNVAQKPLDDPRVRRAIAYAINNQEIVDVALLGVGGLASPGTVFPNGTYYASPDPSYGKPNLDKARALLKEAGFPNGFTLDLKVTSTYDFLRAPAEIIQAQLAPLGIKVNITALEWSVYLPDILAKKYTATILGESGQGDPDDYLYTPFASDSGGNLTNFKDATIDKWLDQGRQMARPGGPQEALRAGAKTPRRAQPDGVPVFQHPVRGRPQEPSWAISTSPTPATSACERPGWSAEPGAVSAPDLSPRSEPQPRCA